MTRKSLKSSFCNCFRNSRPQVFCKKGIFKNFVKFAGKHLRQSLFFNKIADLRPATLVKKRPWYRVQVYSCKFCEIFKSTFFKRTHSVVGSVFSNISCIELFPTFALFLFLLFCVVFIDSGQSPVGCNIFYITGCIWYLKKNHVAANELLDFLVL